MTIEQTSGSEEIYQRRSGAIVSVFLSPIYIIELTFSEDAIFKPIPGHLPELVLLDAEDNEIEVLLNIACTAIHFLCSITFFSASICRICHENNATIYLALVDSS